MEIIRLDECHHKCEDLEPISIALGQFDGLHIAHRALIDSAISYGKEHHMKVGLMTFDPHPDFVLGKSDEFSLVTPIKTKMELLEEMGLDYVFLVEFNKHIASLKPSTFCQEYLLGCHIKHLVCGYDFRYGQFGKGTSKTLEKDCNYEVSVEIIPEILRDDIKVGTQRIRQLLKDGNMPKITELLNRFYHIEGIVAHGKKLGRTIDFPTANIRMTENFILPKIGVYAVIVTLNGDSFKGMVNIGFNPTFNLALKPKMEVHILHFDQSIYGDTLRIYFVSRLRDEIKFESKEALMNQLKIDKQETDQLLEEYIF